MAAKKKTDRDEAKEGQTRSIKGDAKEQIVHSQSVSPDLKASELQYRRLFETAQDAILILDGDTGEVVDANTFILDMLGYPLEYFIGKHLWELGFIKDKSIAQQAFIELKTNRYIRYENIPLETKDKRSIAVEFISNVYLVGDKKIIQCNIRDNTDKKVIQDALQASETRYRHLFENAQDAILLLNGDTGEVVDANKFFLDMLGYPLEYFIGKHLWELGFIKDKSIAQQAFKELKTNSYIRYEDIPLETKDGRSIDVEFISNAYVVGEKKIIQCNIRNITDRKLVEEALKKYSDKLEEIVSERTKELREAQEELVKKERFAVLGKLSGVVGHELRNPLGAIKNVAYFLNMALENPDDEIREMLDILNKEVARSEDIISTLLDFARPKAPALASTDVNHVITETLKRFPLPHNIKLNNTMSSTLPEIPADANQLLQVFSNLIINAYQAMPEGGIVTITSNEQIPGWVALSVADTGVGISDENMKKLFEPLFTTKAKGLGLGLVVIKTIIEAHCGRIEVKSEAGKGAMFTVILPIHGKEEVVK